MILQGTFDGKPALVAFFDDNFEACDRDVAVICKVLFDDGSNMFVAPEALTQPQAADAAGHV